MERYKMNTSCCRPYNRTCGMMRQDFPQMREQTPDSCPCRDVPKCNCRMPGAPSYDAEMYSHLAHLEPAMAYVPCQTFGETFSLDHALSVGTIFPVLCKPFCGKRGVCR